MVKNNKKPETEKITSTKKKQSTFQNEIKILFDIVNQKSLKMLDDRIKKLYLNQKSNTRREFIHNNVHPSNTSGDQMDVEESSKYRSQNYYNTTNNNIQVNNSVL